MTSKASLPSSTVQTVDVAIVGSGFGGLCAAIQLLKSGNDSFVILEKGDDIGGTWNFNNYPGAACDVQSHMYSFSFEGNPDWSKRFASRNEIKAYIDGVADKYDLRSFTRFGQEVNEARFDEATARWTLRTKAGDTIDAKYFLLASGPLHVVSKPNIKGLDTFKGKVMHSAEWDHSYDIRGKRVASIGTGASAIQYCPEIAPQVAQLHVFQRTPAWIVPRDDRSYLGIEKAAFARFPLLRKLHRARFYWSNEARLLGAFNPKAAKVLEAVSKLLLRIQVPDAALRAKLTPDYTIGCKRVLISNKWFPMFNRKNVELVTDGIQEITENGIITKDGQLREVDTIILGTGFVVDPRLYMQSFPVTGLGGRDLRQDWKNASEAYLGTTVAGYPNMFQLVGPNTGLGHSSIIFMIEAQVNLILQCMNLVKQKQADWIDVKSEVQNEFNAQVQRDLQGTVWTSGCSSWYQQADGKNTALWPYTTIKFWFDTRKAKPEEYVFGIASEKLGQVKKKAAVPA